MKSSVFTDCCTAVACAQPLPWQVYMLTMYAELGPQALAKPTKQGRLTFVRPANRRIQHLPRERRRMA